MNQSGAPSRCGKVVTYFSFFLKVKLASNNLHHPKLTHFRLSKALMMRPKPQNWPAQRYHKPHMLACSRRRRSRAFSRSKNLNL